MKVLNFGSLNIDYVYDVAHIVVESETIPAVNRKIFCGGKGLNQSIALSKAGVPTYHAGRICNTDQFLVEMLQTAHVDISNVILDDSTPTGHAIIQKTPDGTNCIIVYGGANRAITKAQIETTIAQFDVGDYLVLQNETNDIGYMIECANKRGMVIVLNPSPMEHNILDLPLTFVDWFMLNEIEAAALICQNTLAGISPESLLHAVTQRFPNANVVITLGAKGAICKYQEQIIYRPAKSVVPVDTTAAGDTFTGFFLAGIMKQKSIEDCLNLATTASAIAVTRMGAAPSIPSLCEVLNSIH